MSKQNIIIGKILPIAGGFIPIPKRNSPDHKKFNFLNSFVTNLNELKKIPKYSR